LWYRMLLLCSLLLAMPLLIMRAGYFLATSTQQNVSRQAVSTCTVQRRFTVYDNTHYSGIDLEQYGLIKSNILEEDTASKQAIVAGKTPDKALLKQRIAQNDKNSGPLVIDFEDLYLTGTSTTAQHHFQILVQLAQWAHEAASGKIIGFYGLLNNTNAKYISLARQLVRYEDAFFPSLYTFSSDRTQWHQHLMQDVHLAQKIAPGKPVYPYIWPQYHEHTPQALQYIDASYWLFQLDELHQYTDGAVIWSSTKPNGNNGWVSATAQFMKSISTC
jgi:hypothetical protein